MSIKPADLEAVRDVLTGRTTPHQAALKYSTIQKVLLAHAALAAGNFVRPAWRAQFGELLSELALAAATPADGWPLNEHGGTDHPDWYWQQECQLVPTSRRLGLHAASDRAGNNLRTQPSPEILRLLEDPQCHRVAQELYETAVNAVNARRAAKQGYQDRIRRFKAAAQAHPDAGYYFGQLLQCTSEPAELAKIHHILGELLQQYFPELLP